jgi:hypothetical protein
MNQEGRGEYRPEAEQEQPTQAEFDRLKTVLAELNEFAKKPWFRVVTEGMILGPTRLIESGVQRLAKKLGSKPNKH